MRDNEGAYGQTFKIESGLWEYGTGLSHEVALGRTPINNPVELSSSRVRVVGAQEFLEVFDSLP